MSGYRYVCELTQEDGTRLVEEVDMSRPDYSESTVMMEIIERRNKAHGQPLWEDMPRETSRDERLKHRLNIRKFKISEIIEI